LPPQTHGNNIAELVWTVVPTLIVAFLFVVSWQTLNTVEAVSANPETRIRAVAGQFQWKFDYFDASGDNVVYTEFLPTLQDNGDGGMVIPAGRSVLLTLESPDVLHAFYVPQFLFKRDVVPGRVNSFEFKVNADDAGGVFRGQCAELCGAKHREMLFDVRALAPAEFDAWLAEKIETANATPPPAPSGEPGASAPAGPAVVVSAVNLAFDQTALTAPAGAPFKLEFDNNDPSIPHNVEIKDAGGASVFNGEIFNGVDKRTYDVPALTAGAYTFLCTVHTTMTGTLTAN
jgi:heme/copper-type cytochrome/quinol oxidase subunit 2